MTSLFSNTMSPAKDGSSSLPRRSSNLGKPPLRALYDLLIAPMEGVRATLERIIVQLDVELFLKRHFTSKHVSKALFAPFPEEFHNVTTVLVFDRA